VKRGCRKPSAKVVLSMAICLPSDDSSATFGNSCQGQEREEGGGERERRELRSRAGMTWHLQLF
jgi:hypothetical protein